jgi:hypothetical protein
MSTRLFSYRKAISLSIGVLLTLSNSASQTHAWTPEKPHDNRVMMPMSLTNSQFKSIILYIEFSRQHQCNPIFSVFYGSGAPANLTKTPYQARGNLNIETTSSSGKQQFNFPSPYIATYSNGFDAGAFTDIAFINSLIRADQISVSLNNEYRAIFEPSRWGVKSQAVINAYNNCLGR